MEYAFSKEELSIRETIRHFARKEIAPLVGQIEEKGKIH